MPGRWGRVGGRNWGGRDAGGRTRRRRWFRWAVVQGVVHAGHQFVNRDLEAVIAIELRADSERRVPKGDVHPRHQLIHGHLPVAMAVTDACGDGNGRACQQAETSDCEDQTDNPPPRTSLATSTCHWCAVSWWLLSHFCSLADHRPH